MRLDSIYIEYTDYGRVSNRTSPGPTLWVYNRHATVSTDTVHALTLLTSLASALARSPRSRFAPAASPAVLASLAASPLLLSLDSRRLLASLACCLLLASLALPGTCFARRLSRCSLRSPPVLLPSLRPPGLRARSARHLACCSRFASQLACCALRSPPRLPRSLRSPLAIPPAARFVRRLTCWFCLPTSLTLPASPAPAFLAGTSSRRRSPARRSFV